MANPILIEVTRGSLIESVHRGALAVADADGRLRSALGDVERPIFPRSALKPIQAIPLVESGAADAFAVSDEELALACASHSGEKMHTERVALWLKRIGCGEVDLACGVHPLRYEPLHEAMLRAGEKPTRIHNNCSGKHTGFLTTAKHLGAPLKGYIEVDHPVQRAVLQTLKELADITGELPWGVDGCAAPNFALPLKNLARAAAQLADPRGLSPARAGATKRIMAAMTAHPDLAAGTGRACTALIREGKGKVAVKTGAEGVYVAMLPALALGIALKIDDGAARAAECAIAQVLLALGAAAPGGEASRLARADVRNARGERVGERRPAEALLTLR